MSEHDPERDGFDRDDDQRALLRGGDPARSPRGAAPAPAPPAPDPVALSRLLEDTMSADLEIRPVAPDDGTRAAGTHGRNRLTWLAAPAAVALLARGGGGAIARWARPRVRGGGRVGGRGVGGESHPPAASLRPPDHHSSEHDRPDDGRRSG